jgi:hypothetical protein
MNDIAFPVKFIANQISCMNAKEMAMIAQTVVALDEGQAERLKNAIAVAQQERDLAFLEQEKQYEEASRMADMDSQYYGERV